MQVFQVVPPVVRDVGNGFEIDQDFANSLKIYLDHFESFAVACPVRTSDIKGSGLEQCIPISDLPWGPDRFKFIPLPWAYEPIAFLTAFLRVRRLLRAEIEASDYLIFTPSALIGDWPTVAVREAVRLGRPYTIEADGVHGDITRKRHISNVAWKRAVKRNILFPLADRSLRYCLSRSSLAVFQGQDVYNAYARHCANPHKLNHHVPVYAGDHISDAQLHAKLGSISRGDPLKICYAGRAIDMKGPLEWVDTLSELSRRGVSFDAIWLGDGPMLEEMQARTAALGVPGITFAGFVAERHAVLDALKQAHIFLFCHNTLESARILGEALACGAPLVGFETDYPADLVAEYGGGMFCEMGDVKALAQKVQELDGDRDRLSTLVTDAARSGRDLDREAALRRRAELVKEQRFCRDAG